jgi:penicillin-binding protein 1A
MANGGSYIEPQIVTAVEDRKHNVLESFASKGAEQALNSGADATLVDVLRGVVDYGTAAGLKQRFGLNGDLAGKTGTTQDYTDGWFILMHPNLVAGAWVGFNDNRVTLRSSYWGQGAHNALLLVGDFMQQSTKAGLVDPKASFAAPHTRGQDKPLMDRMGDWWASVFNTNPNGTTTDSTTAALPPVDTTPPNLEPPPSTAQVPSAPTPLPYPAPAVSPDAPVIVDGQAQRVPSYPRSADSGRPVDTIPGTQVYPTPGATARAGAPEPSQSADVVHGPTASARAGGGSLGMGGASSSTSAMGAAGSTARGSDGMSVRSDGTSSRTDGTTSRTDTTTSRSDATSSRGDASASRSQNMAPVVRDEESTGAGSSTSRRSTSDTTAAPSGGSGSSDASVGNATGSASGGDSGQ